LEISLEAQQRNSIDHDLRLSLGMGIWLSLNPGVVADHVGSAD
jgi:hypothetical protein